MLVDLGRNDLGRVSRPGTVTVSKYMDVEKYSHVLHLVSHVEGKLKPDADALDAQHIQGRFHRFRQRIRITGIDLLGRSAMSRQFQRDGHLAFRQGRLVEHPGVEAGAEPVQQHERLALAVDLVVHLQAVDGGVPGARGRVDRSGHGATLPRALSRRRGPC